MSEKQKQPVDEKDAVKAYKRSKTEHHWQDAIDEEELNDDVMDFLKRKFK